MTRPFPIDPLTHPDIVCYIIPYLRARPKDTQTLARAALVNKAWNAVYTPVLWSEVYLDRLDHDDDTRISPCLDLQRYGTYVRRLEFQYLDSSHLHLVTTAPQQQQQEQQQEQHRSWVSLCPNLESLRLLEYNAPLEELYRFLKSVKSPLQQFSLYTVTMSPEDVIAALVTMTNSITGGNHVGFEALTKLELGFDIFGDKVDLRWSSLVRLLEAFPYLEMLDLAELNLGAPAATTDNNEQEGDEEIIDEKGHSQGLQAICPLQGQQSNITNLALRQLTVDDRTLLRLFGKTPHLKDLYLSFIIITKVDNVIGALPTLCPDLKRLDIITRIPIPDFYTVRRLPPTRASITAATVGYKFAFETPRF